MPDPPRRGRPPADDPASRMLYMRVTQHEWALLTDLAVQAGLQHNGKPSPSQAAALLVRAGLETLEGRSRG